MAGLFLRIVPEPKGIWYIVRVHGILPFMEEPAERPGNVEASLHDRNYMDSYLRNPVGADQLLADWSREKRSLNGRWNYAVDQYNTCLRAGWHYYGDRRSILENFSHHMDRFGIPKGVRKGLELLNLPKIVKGLTPLDFDFDAWETMEIPASANLVKPELFLYEGPLVFTRTFNWDARRNERVFLRIAGANYRTVVIVNGRTMGCHFGGSTDFFIELGSALNRKHNRLVLVVDASRKSSQVPAENIDWFNYAGLYRDVELVRVPRHFIRNFRIALVPDGRFREIECEVFLSDSQEVSIRLEIPELAVDLEFSAESGYARVRLEADGLELWSPESPKLYQVRLSIDGDSLNDEIGFREIRTEGDRILLNGRDIRFRSVSCHEESLVNGRSLSEDEIIQNFELAKEMGCNGMRLAHYPHSRESARIADRMGLLLWEEIPVYWAIDFENPETYADAENQLSELIMRDWNRASVAIWSVGNENADTDERLSFMSNLAARCRRLDPTRLVSAACLVNWKDRTIDDRLAAHLDVVGLNEYFGWYEPGIDKLKDLFRKTSIDKPFIISEFGAGMDTESPGREGGGFFSEKKHRKVFEAQVKTIRSIDRIRGVSPWILYDFRSPRRTNPLQKYRNLKGLLNAEKTVKKPGFYIMQDFFRDWEP